MIAVVVVGSACSIIFVVVAGISPGGGYIRTLRYILGRVLKVVVVGSCVCGASSTICLTYGFVSK